MAKETFSDAKKRLLSGLRELGWAVKDRSAYGETMKVPHATSPDGRFRLWFKPQAVWMSEVGRGISHELGHARSLFVEIRGTDAADLARYATG